ncbi:MAG TPA: sensor histidine kinase [Rectinemataceae bacterium]
MHYSIADFIVDIAQNAAEADSALVEIEIEESADAFSVKVKDDGRGMDREEAARALDPFYTDGKKHPGRKVGLGLPFLKQAIDLNGGEFSLDTGKGRGTLVAFRFDTGQIDCPPVGDLAQALFSLLCLPSSAELRIRRRRSSGSAGRAGISGKAGLDYELVKSELVKAVGDLEESGSLALLRRYLISQEED